jgi:hypothetical protein
MCGSSTGTYLRGKAKIEFTLKRNVVFINMA